MWKNVSEERDRRADRLRFLAIGSHKRVETNWEVTDS
jgi:hypothetical protein